MSKYIINHDDPIRALSYSQIATFLRCRKQWEYSYRQNIVPSRDHTSLTIGRLVHAGMAGYWKAKALNNNEPVDRGVGEAAIQEECDRNIILMEGDELDLYEDLRADATEIYYRALSDFRPDEWAVETIGGEPAVEVRFAVPLVRKVPLQGYIDLVAVDLVDGSRWQIDWKFVSSLSEKDDELFNLQNVIYQWVMHRIGHPVLGSLTFRHLNKPSTKPRVNQNGTISRALIRCSWEDYARFCESKGQDPEDYREEMEPKLAGIQWSMETREYRNPEMLRTLWEKEVRGTAHEILKLQTRYPRNISPMTCKMCQYQSLCHGEMRGYDTAGILEHEFRTK